MKKSKLLHVISIIVIVFGALGLASSVITAITLPMISDVYTSYGIESPGISSIIYSFASSAIILACGILGVMYKSRKHILIAGSLYFLIEVINIIISSVTVGFSFLYVIDLILPILYLWGWYQSE